MSGVIEHIRRNAVGYVALFVALGGTGYAAANLPRGSVGPRQLRNHSITPVKLNPKSITGSVRAWAVVGSDGRVIAGGGKPKGGTPVTPGVYGLSWGVSLKKNCAAVASIDFAHSPITEDIPVPGNPSLPITSGYAVAENFGAGRGRSNNNTTVHTFNQQGLLTSLGFDVVVTC